MKSVFILTYGWTDQPNLVRETHDSIDSAEGSGNAFLATEKRFAALGHGAPAYYQIDRYNFDVVISRKENDNV